MTPDLFWKIAARAQQLRSAEREARLAQESLVRARDALLAALTDAGLDPNKNYRLDEVGMTVVEAPAPENAL